MDARLDSAFESWGHFSKTMTAPPVVPGCLTYDPLKGINLELAGSLSEGDLQTLMALPRLPTLYGRLVDGELVTLDDCITTKTQMGAGVAAMTTALFAHRMLVGAHVDNLDQLDIKSYTIEFSSLANWTCPSPPVKLEMPKTDGECIGVDVRFRPPDPINIDLCERNFDLEISHGWRTSQASGSSGIRWHAGVMVKAHDSMVLAAASEIAWQCKNLMSMLIGDHLSVKSIAIKPVESVSEGTIELPLRLIYQQCGKHNHPDLHSFEMLLPYSLVKEVFPQIVANWFMRSDQAVLATNVFFGLQLLESAALNVKFLAITQAAESYHRSLGDGFYMDEDDYKTAIKPFLSQMPTVIQGGHRQSLKNRLKYGNELSLRKRLTEMLKRIPENVRSRIAVDVSKFVGRVVDTRNYFTHYDHTSEQNALNGKDALVACERLRILVVANLLQDLGIKDEMLLSALERNREFQHWMSQDLSL